GLMSCTALFPHEASEEERVDYAAAQTARASSPARGRAAYEKFLAEHPDSALAGDASLALAELARAEGRNEEARRRYAEAARQTGRAADRARVQLAAIELERGDSAAARRWLERVRLAQ